MDPVENTLMDPFKKTVMKHRYEKSGGIIWPDLPAHCAISNEGGFVQVLCGLQLGASRESWCSPQMFMGQPVVCSHCKYHPDLGMYLLADVP